MATRKPPRRRCKGTTKAGKRCRAQPLKSTNHCLAHSDEEVRGSVGFGGPQPGSGRPAVPRVTTLMRQRVEEEAEAILKPYFDALEHAVMYATYEGEVIPSDLPDLGARIAAAEKLLDRVVGRPVQRSQLSGPDDDPMQMEVIGAVVLNDPKARRAAAELRRGVEAARAVKPVGPGPGD